MYKYLAYSLMKCSATFTKKIIKGKNFTIFCSDTTGGSRTTQGEKRGGKRGGGVGGGKGGLYNKIFNI
jgi:hypothetical protein